MIVQESPLKWYLCLDLPGIPFERTRGLFVVQKHYILFYFFGKLAYGPSKATVVECYAPLFVFSAASPSTAHFSVRFLSLISVQPPFSVKRTIVEHFLIAEHITLPEHETVFIRCSLKSLMSCFPARPLNAVSYLLPSSNYCEPTSGKNRLHNA